jgi:hypothetical protein
MLFVIFYIIVCAQGKIIYTFEIIFLFDEILFSLFTKYQLEEFEKR